MASRHQKNIIPLPFVFLLVGFLVLAQVTWWVVVFLREVDMNAALRAAPESYHRKVMFVSEALFFACLTCFAIYLLYRSLRAEARARENEKNFFELVSHESKTPLTALKLRLESLVEKLKKASPPHVTEVSLSLDEVRRLSSIYEKILSLNRLDRKALYYEPLYLAEVVRENARRLDPWLKAKGAVLSLELEDETIVYGDSLSLGNSIQNLIENSVVYNDQIEKKIGIRVFSEGKKVKLIVTDNGPGIPDIDSHRVFDRFYRGEKAKRMPGSGLGLFLTKSMVEAHAGTIRLLKDLDLKGCRIEISLPAMGVT